MDIDSGQSSQKSATKVGILSRWCVQKAEEGQAVQKLHNSLLHALAVLGGYGREWK